MGAIANLSASLQWDLDDFERGTARIENVFHSIIGLAGDVANAVGQAGRRMTAGMTLPLAGIGALAVKAASDAEELQSAFDFTFGAMSTRMNRWAQDTGDAMGRSTQEMQEGALAFAQLFKAATPNEQAAARLSQRFTTLAQDAASFFNTDFDTAMGKIRSGLTGESEPLRDFGVFISEAAVKTKALELGLISAGQELSEQGKIMARSALIAEGLAAANGDIERTSGSLANRVRELQANLRELAVEIGEYLKPAATAIVSVLQAAVEWFTNLPEGVKRAAVGFGVFLAALGPLSIALSALALMALPLLIGKFLALGGVMGPILVAISAIINPIGTLVVFAGKLAVQMGGVGVVMSALLRIFLRFAGPVGLVVTLLQVFGDDIVRGLRRFADAVGEAVGPAIQQFFVQLAGLAGKVRDAFDRLMQSELGQFLQAIGEAVGWLIENFLAFAGYLTGVVFSAIVTVATILVDFIGGAIEIVSKLLTGDWSGAWDEAVQVVGRAVIRIGNWIKQIWPWLGGAVEMMGRLTGASIETPEQPREPKRIEDGNGEGPPDFAGGDYALAGNPKKERGARKGRRGPTQEDLAKRREEIRLEQEIAVARARGDQDAIRAAERKRDLADAIERYQRAGLSTADARAAAERDLLELDEARAVAWEKALDRQERSLDQQLAELRNDFAHIRALEDEEFLEHRILDYQREGLSLAQAEKRAARDLQVIEEARAEAIERRRADQDAAREVELARLRGDDESAIRAMEDRRRVAERSLELQREFSMAPADALEQAQREAMDRSRAHMQGTFRDAFRNGLQAALNGDLGSFFENWMRDRTFKALSNVLDRLADRLSDLVSGGRGGGGLLGSVLSAFGIASGSTGAPTNLLSGTPYSTPGFNTGGSFRVKGFPGIDKNLLALNGNPIARVSSGEIMDIRRGEPAGGTSIVEVRLRDDMLEARIASGSGRIVRAAAPEIAGSGAQMAQNAAARSRKWSLSS